MQHHNGECVCTSSAVSCVAATLILAAAARSPRTSHQTSHCRKPLRTQLPTAQAAGCCSTSVGRLMGKVAQVAAFLIKGSCPLFPLSIRAEVPGQAGSSRRGGFMLPPEKSLTAPRALYLSDGRTRVPIRIECPYYLSIEQQIYLRSKACLNRDL